MVAAFAWRRRQEWVLTAQLASWMLNAWTGKGSAAITPKRLLGSDFFDSESKGIHVKDRESWNEYKSDLTRMAQFHSKVWRQQRDGQRQFTSVKDKGQMVRHNQVKGAS